MTPQSHFDFIKNKMSGNLADEIAFYASGGRPLPLQQPVGIGSTCAWADCSARWEPTCLISLPSPPPPPELCASVMLHCDCSTVCLTACEAGHLSWLSLFTWNKTLKHWGLGEGRERGRVSGHGLRRASVRASWCAGLGEGSSRCQAWGFMTRGLWFCFFF